MSWLNPLLIKRSILLFWALYFLLVLSSNLGDALKEIGLLPADWIYASGNYGLIQKVVNIYSFPSFITAILFAGVLLLQLLITIYFWQAYREHQLSDSELMRLVYRAFGTAFLLWFLFILSDEFFLVYDKIAGLERGHFGMLVAQIVTFLTITLVPDRATPS